MCKTTLNLLVHVAHDIIGGYRKYERAPVEYVTNSFFFFGAVLCVKHHPGEPSSALRHMCLRVGIRGHILPYASLSRQPRGPCDESL